VIFDKQGAELAKFQGYVPPGRMASLLQGIIDDPTPGPSVMDARPATATEAKQPRLTDPQRAELLDLLAMRYDTERGGWGFTHKFLDWDVGSACRAQEGDAKAEAMARETSRSRRSSSPGLGRREQYSDGDWDHRT
jgi:hypothetical protein